MPLIVQSNIHGWRRFAGRSDGLKNPRTRRFDQARKKPAPDGVADAALMTREMARGFEKPLAIVFGPGAAARGSEYIGRARQSS
jgi:hypothetical protein